MEHYSTYDLIVQLVNKLFVYTDTRDWPKLQSDVFTDKVEFDMSSLGGQKAELKAADICASWETGFTGIDSINHLAGNYIIDIAESTASVFAYATATHYKKDTKNGTTREFVGTYDIGIIRAGDQWKINSFRYNLKYATGNVDFSQACGPCSISERRL